MASQARIDTLLHGAIAIVSQDGTQIALQPAYECSDVRVAARWLGPKPGLYLQLGLGYQHPTYRTLAFRNYFLHTTRLSTNTRPLH
jgi:hypothetical protein